MTDWDIYLPQVMEAYNSTQHSTTGNSPHMMMNCADEKQARARQRKKFDKEATGAKAYSVGDHVWVLQKVIGRKRTKKEKGSWYGGAPGGTFL